MIGPKSSSLPSLQAFAVSLLALSLQVPAQQAHADAPDRHTISSTARSLSFTGTARDSVSGKVVYLERHTTWFQGDTLVHAETRYESPAGTPWALLETRSLSAQDRLSYHFTDLRTGEIHGVKIDESGLPIMFFRKPGSVDLSEQAYEHEASSPLTVAGQGFHWHIRDRLKNGQLRPPEESSFRLLLPPLFDYFTFKIEAEREEDGKVYIGVDLDNFLLRFFAGAGMHLVYNRDDGQLLEYLGPSNLADDNGDLIKHVQIRYQYPSQPKASL